MKKLKNIEVNYSKILIGFKIIKILNKIMFEKTYNY